MIFVQNTHFLTFRSIGLQHNLVLKSSHYSILHELKRFSHVAVVTDCDSQKLAITHLEN